MADQLTTTVSQQASTQTQNPQAVGQSSTLNGQTKNTQGSAVSSSSLNTTTAVGGIPLVNTSPTIVNVGSVTTRTVAVAKTTHPKQHHHINPFAASLVLILVVVAVVIGINITRSSKITTDY